MERVLRDFKTALYICAALTLLIAFFPSALGEVLLISPTPKSDPGPAGGDFPPSRFGDEPAQPYVNESYSKRTPAALTYEDEYKRRPKRDKNLMSNETSTARMSQVEAPKMASNDLIPDDKKGIQEVAIIAGEIGFFPKTFFVNRNIPVRLFVTGSSKNTLCIMMDTFQVHKQVHANEIQEITFTPKSPGIYRFYCPINGMEGTMVVRELALN